MSIPEIDWCVGGFSAGGSCTFLTIGPAGYHKCGGPARARNSDTLTIVTGLRLARRLVGEGRPRFSATALTRCGTGQSTFA
jgi:hypothetical protein